MLLPAQLLSAAGRDYTWLDGPTGVDQADKEIRWGNMASGAMMSWVNDQMPGGLGIGSEAFELLNIAATIFADPNIEGIPIKADMQNTSRAVDVSRQMIIAQDSGGSGGKHWITDNAAPHPRVWRIKGYLTSLSKTLDAALIIKPTLQMQVQLLDFYASSRRPIWFKAHYSLFYKVLIESFEYDFDPKAQNVIPVNITLCEFLANMAYSNKAGQEAGSRIQDRSEIGEPLKVLDKAG